MPNKDCIFKVGGGEGEVFEYALREKKKIINLMKLKYNVYLCFFLKRTLFRN